MMNGSRANIYDDTHSLWSSDAKSEKFQNYISNHQVENVSPKLGKPDAPMKLVESQTIGHEIISLPPKMSKKYLLKGEVSTLSHYKEFRAQSKEDGSEVLIRVLELNSKPSQQEIDIAVTGFIKELLRLCIIQREEIFIQDFEQGEGVMTYVKRPGVPLRKLMDKKKDVDFEVLIKHVLADLDFMKNEILIGDIPIGFENIYRTETNHKFFVDHWSFVQQEPDNSDFQEQIYALGLIALEFEGIDKQYLKILTETSDIKAHNGVFKEFVEDSSFPENVKATLLQMLDKDSVSRSKCSDLIGERTSKKQGQSGFSELKNMESLYLPK